jgi:hypothetical protein
MTDTLRCSECGTWRLPDELLRIRERARPWRERFICRPSLDGGFCFRNGTRSAALEAIEVAA